MQAIGTLLSMVFFLALAGIAVLHISDLQDDIEGQGNVVGTLAQQLTSMSVVLLLGGVGVIALTALAVWLWQNVR